MKPRLNATLIPTLLAAALVGCSEEPGAHSAHNHGAGDHEHSAAAEPGRPACAAHGAPVALCFICNPNLRDPERLWCNEHKRYEDRCWLCRPEVRDMDRPFCQEHNLYQDECFLCQPAILETSTTVLTGHSSQTAPLFCEEHGLPEAQCGICRPDQVAQLAPGQSLKVRLPSPTSAQSAGVQVGKPSTGGISEGIETYAELAFDQNKLAQLVAPVGGIIQEVAVDLGETVEANQPVARLWSADIAEAVAQAVLSHQTLDRERRLRAERVTSEQDLQEAEADHRAACQQLRTFGFTEEQIDALGARPQDSVLLDVRAPFAGEIVERVAVRGELVEPGRKLFTLADRSVMWAMLNIPETALGRVRLGQSVELRFDSFPEQVFTGELTWISAEVDERSRMVRARAEVLNPDRVLKARMFARARLLTRSPEGALLLPANAVQQVDGRTIVFVKIEEDLFEARGVRIGARLDDRVEILAGLQTGEDVALQHVFPLKSQLLISRLGAGCAHE